MPGCGPVAEIEAERNRAEGPGIFGDVVAEFAVASGHGLSENAVHVVEGQGDAVNFRFDDVVGFEVRNFAADLSFEKFEFPEVLLFFEREHGREMADALEFFERFAAYALSGRVRRHQLRVCGFELFQFIEDHVILTVGDFWRGVGVVEAVMPRKRFAQIGDTLLGVHVCSSPGAFRARHSPQKKTDAAPRASAPTSARSEDRVGVNRW